MAQPSKRYLEIEERLGQSLADLIASRRGEGIAWRRIALEVTARTGIDVTGESLRMWFQGREPVATRASAA
jgi:hypothetical protein